MENHQPIILAVNSGTREVGTAVLEDSELIFYGIKTVTNQKTATTLLYNISSVIDHLINTYHPTHLAIKKVIVIQKSTAMVAVVAEQIKAIAKQHGLEIIECDSITVRQFICRTRKATKQRTAHKLAERYSELTKYTRWQTEEQARYWGRLFDAIAVGLYVKALLSTNTINQKLYAQNRSRFRV